MMHRTLGRRVTVSRLVAGTVSALAVALAGCGGENSGSPVEPNPAPPPAAPDRSLRAASFIFDVDLKAGTVVVSRPEAELSLSILGSRSKGAPSYSILSGNSIAINSSAFSATAIGAQTPNKVEVTFDVSVANQLAGYDLVTSTFPAAPTGQAGVLLIPYSYNVTNTVTGIGVEGGNTVVVELPSSGEVVANRNWNGSAALDRPVFPANPGAGGDPFNFFNDALCNVNDPSTPSDCFRYETMGVVRSGASSAARRVGFSVDGSVGQFRVRMLAIADVNPVGAGGAASVSGIVTSPQAGPLAGVTVTLAGAGAPLTATTSATGAYSFAGAPEGTRTIGLSGLPTGCTRVDPSLPAVTIASGGTITQDFSVTCGERLGTVAGSVARSGSGSQDISGASVVIDPAASGAASLTVALTGFGLPFPYSSSQVPVGGLGALGEGEGTVSVINLPDGCVFSTPAPYAGLTPSAAATVNLTVECTAPITGGSSRYEYRNVWSTPTASSVSLFISFDPSGFNDPAINGAAADGFSGIQAQTALVGDLSRVASVTQAAVLPFSVIGLGGTTANLAWLAGTTSGDATGNTIVTSFQFTLTGGAGGTLTTATSTAPGTFVVSNTASEEYNLEFSGASQNINITEATVTLP